MNITELEYPKPQNGGRLTNNDILFGPPIPAIDRLKIVSPDQFENIIREWVSGFLMKRGDYVSCKKCSGSGDMGRDVIGKVDGVIWDNYQCKHYNSPLAPSEINVEFGKLIYYTYKNQFSLPRKYIFVSPQGAGPKLNQLLDKPDELKKQLIANWEKHCQEEISSKESIPLTEELLKHLNSIDFSIFSAYDPQMLISEHQQTPYYATRFGGGLQKRREHNISVPASIHATELVYTNQLFEAYTDYTKLTITNVEHINDREELVKHFNRQRQSFYSADSLNQFSRDTLPPDTDYFADLKDEFFNGVIDIVDEPYKDGFERLKATTNFAKQIVIDANPLSKQLRISDREGICHHLANENRLRWVK